MTLINWIRLRYPFLEVVLQLTASPWTTETSTSEIWQFGALT